jgi:enamine deaminase RidA (YjgF/YER057c/UK114 family)
MAGMVLGAAAKLGPRYIGAPDAAISSSVVIPPDCSIAFLSGAAGLRPGEQVPRDPGDTEAQTALALDNIESGLKELGLALGDVVMMRSYLVTDATRGKADFEGYSRAYKRRFGIAEQPNKPARVTVEVAKLVVPGLLVEIEVTAAQCHGKDKR